MQENEALHQGGIIMSKRPHTGKASTEYKYFRIEIFLYCPRNLGQFRFVYRFSFRLILVFHPISNFCTMLCTNLHAREREHNACHGRTRDKHDRMQFLR